MTLSVGVVLALCVHCSSDPTGTPNSSTLDGGSDADVDGAVPDDGRDADADGDADANTDGDAGDADADASFRCPPVMKAIPAGSFDRADIAVTTDPFCLDRTEVTLGSYRACVRAGVCDAIPATVDERCNARASGRDGHPVDCVSAVQAELFCAWMGKRLPTSDELSWAARGAVATATYPWGTDEPTITDSPPRLCWKSVSPDHTCTAGSFPNGASPQGVLDLAGNVWEWTATAGDTASTRRVQGGAYWDDENSLILFQADYWEPMAADSTAPAYGFRCAQ